MRRAAFAVALAMPCLGACSVKSAPPPSFAEQRLNAQPKENTPPAQDDAQAAKNNLVAGVALTAVGASGIGLGGFLIGFGSGACHAQKNCSPETALPILGALWIAGSVVPLILGARFLMPSSEGESGPIQDDPKKNRLAKPIR